MAIYVGDALYAHAQGGCYVCHRGDRLVDTEVQIEGEGALALCTGCISDLAQAAQLTFNEALVSELRENLAQEQTARKAAEEVKTRLLETINSVATAKVRPRR